MAGKPRIGITFSPKRGRAYYEPYERAVSRAGAEPVLLPPGQAALNGIDGLLLPGGWDLDPELYKEARDASVVDVDRELDETELRLVRDARAAELPVLGICRGQQVIAVALGGSLHQHLPEHDLHGKPRTLLAHQVEVEAGSELARATGGAAIEVNSLHHQAVKAVPEELHVTARSEDGVIEGLESGDGLVVAVQCHPEELAGQLAWARSLFERFVQRAAERRRRPGGQAC